jgi:hypothetical protein
MQLAFIDLLKVATCLPIITYLSETGDGFALNVIAGVELFDCSLKRFI